MKSMAKLAALAVFGAALSSTAVMAQPTPDMRSDRITVDYIDPRSPQYDPVMERLKKRRVLEQLAQFLSPLKLPRTLRLRAKQCGEENAFYDPMEWALIICYEYVAGTERDAPGLPTAEGFTREDAIIGGFVDAALHEIGHALFDILDIPVLGREEDGADQVAAFIMTQFGPEVARTTIKGAAYSYKVLGTGRNPVFWDEHGTPTQRFFNYLCIGYGGNPEAFKEFVDKGYLPQSRAASCAREFQQVRKAFAKTILPYIDQELMKKVQATRWLRPEDGQ
ncbi:MAG: hypothetical protein QOI12_1103 [Alphaproteobacteria bacterium]|jgi:hypothetical protein|nr:hypothetical protein [Alphaproteobacteria bacterium]